MIIDDCISECVYDAPSQTMKILQIVDKGPEGGGVARHVHDVTHELRALGHEVTLLRLYDKAHETAPSTTHALPWTFGPLQGARVAGVLRSLLARIAPDVIHLHAGYTTMSPVLVRALRRAHPMVGTLHDVRPFCFAGTRRFRSTAALCQRELGMRCLSSGCYRPRGTAGALRVLRELAVKAWLLREWRRLPAIVVPSAYLGDLAIQHGFAEGRVHVVRHFTDPAAPGVDSAFAQPPMIIYVGGLQQSKGIMLMFEALQHLSDLPWQAAIVGEGPMRSQLAESLKPQDMADRVTFYGTLDVAQRNALLARSRFLVFPSIVAESFGLVGIEAMAHGKAVVSFATAGTAEWFVDGVNGLAARDGSAEDLARVMRVLLQDATLAARLGENGRRQAHEFFTPHTCIAELCAVYLRAQRFYRGQVGNA
jgi:glycosyltransferase involved in cell wall biosynthesis